MAPKQAGTGAISFKETSDAIFGPPKFMHPTEATRINVYFWVGFAWMVSTFAFIGLQITNVNGFTYLHSNQVYGNFTANATSVYTPANFCLAGGLAVPVAPIAVTNLHWLFLGNMIALWAIYWCGVAWRVWDPKSLVQGKIWIGFAIADPIATLTQMILFGSSAFVLINLLGDKDWTANVSLCVITVSFFAWCLVSEYLANYAYNSSSKLASGGRVTNLADFLPDSPYLIFYSVISMGALHFAWIVAALWFPVSLMYGQNISIPTGTLLALGAFTAFVIVRGLTTFVIVTSNFNLIATGPLVPITPMVQEEDKVAKELKYIAEMGYMKYVLVFFSSIQNVWAFIAGSIIIWGIVDQFPAGVVRVA